MIKRFRAVVAKQGLFLRLPYPYPTYNEARLWRRVLDQAVHDLLTGGEIGDITRKWIGTEDFFEVCELATVDPELALKILNFIQNKIERLTRD